MTKTQEVAMTKKMTSVLTNELNTKKKRDAIVLSGVINEALGWWQVAKGLYETKQAINRGDEEYQTIKVDKNGTPVLDDEGNEQITQHTFKSYCEDTYTEAGLSRSRREELVTAYNILINLQQEGFAVEDLPKVAYHCKLLNKVDMADRAKAWEEYLDTLNVGSIEAYIPKKKEVIEDKAEPAIEDTEEVIEEDQNKPLEWFAQQFLDRIKDRAVMNEDLMAITSQEIIRQLERYAYEETAKASEE